MKWKEAVYYSKINQAVRRDRYKVYVKFADGSCDIFERRLRIWRSATFRELYKLDQLDDWEDRKEEIR